MRRIWILVPFWAFFLAYLVYSAHERRREARVESAAVAGESPATDRREPPGVSGGGAREGGVPPPDALAQPGRVREELPAGVGDAALGARVAEVARNVFVLPRVKPASPVSFLWPVDGAGSPDQPELLGIASRPSFARWILHEDEWIRFYYPDDPAVRLEILAGAAPFPMLGETMWTVADAPERRYRLATVGGATFCMISLERADRFDDTARFPKPEAFHRQWVGDGSLCRAALMEDGNLRRVEILAGGYRASVLDWPHCAIHREVYERLAFSVRLGVPIADGAALRASRWSEAGLGARLGFLDPGMDAAAVRALLGEPVGNDGKVLVFQEHGGVGEDAYVYRVPVAGGHFGGFAQDWKSRRHGPPDAGSLAWMLEKTGGTGGAEGAVGYDLGSLTEEEAVLMFDRFCAEAPTVDAAGWDPWCRVIANLTEMGERDERVPAHIGARFLDPALPQAHATQVLHAYDPVGCRDLFAARLEGLLARAPGPASDSGVPHDLQILFAYLGREDARSAPLLERALRHADGAIREVGHGYRSWLPEASASVYLEQGLADSRPGVRRRCAEALCAETTAPPDRLALVERRLAEEDDAETRAYLEEARRLHRAADEGAARAPGAEDASS